MTDKAPIRLGKAAKELNVGLNNLVDFLASKKIVVDRNPNAKLEADHFQLLVNEFAPDRANKQKSDELAQNKLVRETITIENQRKARPDDFIEQEEVVLIKEVSGATTTDFIKHKAPEKEGPVVLGKIDLDAQRRPKPAPAPAAKPAPAQPAPAPAPVIAVAPDPAPVAPKPVETEVAPPAVEATVAPVIPAEPELMRAKADRLTGPTVKGKIDLPVQTRPDKRPDASSAASANERHKRKRIAKSVPNTGFKPSVTTSGASSNTRFQRPQQQATKPAPKVELTPEQIQNQVRETLAALKNKGKSTRSKYRKERRDAVSEKSQREAEELQELDKRLKLTEFVTVSELATMMNVPVNQVIGTCMSIGMMVSINQRLDSETLTMLAQEYGFEVEFVSAEIEESIQQSDDDEQGEVSERPPIVTVMGHVDHGKTSLLDFIRRENVIAGEAGGITQHIGAYSVGLENGKTITFLDTPGHEAFTAMRARGAQVTDLAIIVIAADDAVKPQTVEAINHAQAAGVPMVFALNKVDKEGAQPDKIREQLAAMNLLVEEWGGKFQCQEISAKKGTGVHELLEKVLLEAELLELKASAARSAKGTIIEASLDKGRGYTSTVLVQAGTLRVGDMMLAGSYYGRIKALFNERGHRIEEAGPSTPVSILGLNGAPSAGDNFLVMADESEAKNIASRRQQLQREQSIRTQRRRTLEEIGEILQKSDYHEINLIVKGDVDGSVEALADSMLKISTSTVKINVLHKSVGQITESDVLLATASDAIIIGFQVRPSGQARKLAETEGVQIRMYSIIYDAINDMKAAMEGMLKPKLVEQVVCNIEVRDVFVISKVGTIAGCYVLDGVVSRNTKVRVIRDGIVVHSGSLGSLKRFKDDVREVKTGFECGLNIDGFNDVQVGDIIEGYEEVEVARKLE